MFFNLFDQINFNKIDNQYFAIDFDKLNNKVNFKNFFQSLKQTDKDSNIENTTKNVNTEELKKYIENIANINKRVISAEELKKYIENIANINKRVISAEELQGCEKFYNEFKEYNEKYKTYILNSLEDFINKLKSDELK